MRRIILQALTKSSVGSVANNGKLPANQNIIYDSPSLRVCCSCLHMQPQSQQVLGLPLTLSRVQDRITIKEVFRVGRGGQVLLENIYLSGIVELVVKCPYNLE
jgi:hypothetical protein